MGNSAFQADGGRHTFPRNLYGIVEEGPPELIDWVHDGVAFRILNEPLFGARILPQHFAQTKMASFRRQLSIYGFRRALKRDAAFFHPNFIRSRPELLELIKRVPNKSLAPDNAQISSSSDEVCRAGSVAVSFHSSRTSSSSGTGQWVARSAVTSIPERDMSSRRGVAAIYAPYAGRG